MAIRNVLINVSDVPASLDLYSRLLAGTIVGSPTAERAVLDFQTAAIELRRLDGGVPCTWQEDDQVRGFRHIGFKVAEVDPLVVELKAAGVPFRIEPLDAAAASYAPAGFANIGTLLFQDDPRGFRIDYLKGGDSVLEVFTFRAGVRSDAPRPDALGFVAVELEGSDDLRPPASADVNDFSFTVGR